MAGPSRSSMKKNLSGISCHTILVPKLDPFEGGYEDGVFVASPKEKIGDHGIIGIL
jgi:hypothetical protein